MESRKSHDGCMDRASARLMAVVAVVGVFGIAAAGFTGCMSSPSSNDSVDEREARLTAARTDDSWVMVDEEELFAPAPGIPIEEYITDESDGVIMKFRPQAWPRVRQTLTKVVDGDVEAGLSAFVGSQLDLDFSFRHLDGSRASYVVFGMGGPHPWNACLQAGLPCSLFGEPSPVWGRLLLPAMDVEGLKSEVARRLGDSDYYRLVAHDAYLRAEFVLGVDAITESIERELEVRRNYVPDTRGLRATPALATLIEHAGVAGLYVDLAEGAALASYLSSLKWHRAYREAPQSKKLRVAFQAALDPFSVAGAEEASPDRFEDGTIVIDGDRESMWMDIVQTRTRRGQQLRREGRRVAVDVDPMLDVGRALDESPWPLAGRAARALDGVLAASSSAPTVSSRDSGALWAAVRHRVGTASAGEPRVIDTDATARQSRRTCLTKLDELTAPLMRKAQTTSKPFEYLYNEMVGITGTFENRALQCGGPGMAAQARAEWAVAAFHTWRALAAWRTKRDGIARNLLDDACQVQLPWACRAPTDEWPWTTDGSEQAAR